MHPYLATKAEHQVRFEIPMFNFWWAGGVDDLTEKSEQCFLQAMLIKCFVSHRPPAHFFLIEKTNITIPDSLVKEARTLIFKHTILFS